ncbi:MAG: FAD-binding oxidoreductase [Gammaproteobacteria bacterium]|nr:FAD-binding oxidoreductase [Gammaproteobacteria bacterium]
MQVVILGAGVIGSAIAYYLSLKGIGATVIERSGVANAASGKSGGFLARDWCSGQAQDELARTSFDLHKDLARTLPADYGYRPVNTFAAAVSVQRSFKRDAFAFGSDWIDGDCAVHQLLGDETSTAQLHPALFTHALLDQAVANGTSLQAGVVESLTIDSATQRLSGVQVDGEFVAADAVVIAMGPWSILAAQWLPLPPVFGLKGYSITLRPRDTIAAETLFLDYEDRAGEHHGPELVPRADGEVYLCGFGDQESVPVSPDDVTVDEQACEHLHAIAGRVSSALKEARITRRQACYRPICQDAMPVMGAVPGVTGAYIATGHNCWGMLNAPGSGLAMAELIADGRATSLDLTPFDPARLEACRVA